MSSREKGGKKASGKHGEDGKGDPLVAGSTAGEHDSVVGKSSEKEADVVAVPSSGGAIATDKHVVGSLREEESEKGDKVKTTDSSALSASDSSDSAIVPMADPDETEIVQSVAKLIHSVSPSIPETGRPARIEISPVIKLLLLLLLLLNDRASAIIMYERATSTRMRTRSVFFLHFNLLHVAFEHGK